MRRKRLQKMLGVIDMSNLFSNLRQKIRKMNYDLVIQFAAPYVLILLVLVILSTTITSVVFDSTLEQSMDYSMLCLNASMDRIDDSMASVHALHDILTNYSPLVKAINSPGMNSSTISNLINLETALLDYDDSLNILHNCAVYSYHNGVTVTAERIILNTEQMYEALLAHGDMRYEQWRETILASRRRSSYFAADTVYPSDPDAIRSIVYTMPFIDLTSGKITGQAIYYLSEQEILSLISDAFEEDGVFAQLLWEDQLLTHIGEGMENAAAVKGSIADGYQKLSVDGEEYYAAYVDSEQLGLRLLIALPESMLYAQCREQLRLLYLCRNILIVFTVAIAAFTIFRNHRPLVGISEHIDGHDDLGLSGVELAVRTMKNDRANLNQAMENQKQQLQEALFRQLVYGISGDEAQMEVQLEYVDVKIGGEEFKARAMYLLMEENGGEIATENLRSVENHRILISNLLQAYSERFIPLLLENRNQIAILYMVDDETDLTPVSELYSQIELETGIHVNFYVGGCFTQLRHAQRSFTEARRLMQSDTLQKERFIAVSDGRNSMNVFDYTAADEERLLNLIEKNAADEIDALLERIYHNNFVRQTLTASMCEMLYYRLLSTIVQHECALPPVDQDLISPRGDCQPASFFAAYRQYIAQLCERVERSQKETRRQLDEDILAFVNENITNNQLSIRMLAMHYGRSESYLSMRFKERVGMTFSAYVEQMRIQLASKMLAESGSSITEISERVGYSSSSAFGRAYKRVMGCTPSEYQTRLADQ